MNIVILGTVGVGKSTISKKLKEIFLEKEKDVFLLKEIEKYNPYLEEHYKDRPAWSFLIQIDFLLDRFNKVYKFSQREGINIFDRHF